MFELPDAKRIRREDLNDSDEASQYASPHDAVARLKKQYENLYQPLPNGDDTPIAIQPTQSLVEAPKELLNEDDGAYEFRLFSKPVSKLSNQEQPPVHPSRILIRSPSPATTEAAFVKQRPNSYYFTGSVNPETKARYCDIAISGQAIKAEAARRFYGCELPWRVRTISLTKVVKSKASMTTFEHSTSRTRVGKKRRIVLRKILAAAKAIEIAASMSAAEKEVAEREKRTRRNREKKVKKKGREKLKKSSVAS